MAADLLGINERTLRRWEAAGRLPHTRRTPGGQRRFLLDDLREVTK
ncbi:MerR family DNA-binding transcriptional regulator [Arthrobacter woluwensis]